MISTRKANTLDVVELLEDLPEYGVKRGEKGTVVEVFDEPEEAYMIEFGDESGTSSRIADWVKPDQITNVLKTRKAQEHDVVELTEDLPKYGLKRGERGAVIVTFDDPSEAYDLEFVDESGESRFAYSVKPEQIINIDCVAREIFERGMELLFNRGLIPEAERDFRKAIDLRPSYISVLHNFIVKGFEKSDDWQKRIDAMRFVLRVSPHYEIARNNLAIAFLNHGVQKARDGDFWAAHVMYYEALGIDASPEVISDLRRNLAAAHTGLGIRAHALGKLIDSATELARACAFHPNEQTRHNMGLAYAFLANSSLAEDNLKDAIRFFENAEDTGLRLPNFINSYGVALALSGRFSEAARAFERALELAPEDETIQANLNLARKDVVAGFNVEKIEARFYPPPPIQPMEYQVAA